MKKYFEAIEELQPYYDEKNRTYEFSKDGEYFDIFLDFGLDVQAKIHARDIEASSIRSWSISARDIMVHDDIKARGILSARSINASDIIAEKISAKNIMYYSLCIAKMSFECQSVTGMGDKTLCTCLGGEIKYI